MALVRTIGTPGGGAVIIPDPATADGPLELGGVHGESLFRVLALVRHGGAGVVELAQTGGCLPGRDPDAETAGAILVESRLAPPRMLVFGAGPGVRRGHGLAPEPPAAG